MGQKTWDSDGHFQLQKTYKYVLFLIVIAEIKEQKERSKSKKREKRARVTELQYSVIRKGFQNFFVSLSLPSRHLLQSFVRII